MPAHTYHFDDRWMIPGIPPSEVWPVVTDSTLLPEWWKGVFLESHRIAGGAEPKVGDRARVKIRGFLPYALDFDMETTAMETGRLIEVRTSGDFDGAWRMVLEARDGGTAIDIVWTVEVHKRGVRFLSPLLKPLFRRNHDWSAVRGEAGLRAYFTDQCAAVGRPVTEEAT